MTTMIWCCIMMSHNMWVQLTWDTFMMGGSAETKWGGVLDEYDWMVD